MPPRHGHLIADYGRDVTSYLSAGIVAAVGLALLIAVLVPALRRVRRFGTTAAVVNTRFSNQTGTLRARVAALRIAIRDRTRDRVAPAPAHVPSVRRGRQEEDRG